MPSIDNIRNVTAELLAPVQSVHYIAHIAQTVTLLYSSTYVFISMYMPSTSFIFRRYDSYNDMLYHHKYYKFSTSLSFSLKIFLSSHKVDSIFSNEN